MTIRAAVDVRVTVRDAYVDAGVSGAKAARPGLDRLLADVRAQQVDVVVIAKLDGRPTKAVWALEVAPSTAQLYVKKARERGFLTVPAPGSTGP